MTGFMKIMMLAVLPIGFMTQASSAYDVPQRRIDLKPYLNFMFPNNLMESNNLNTPVMNEMGVGFGVKARTQITGYWGFVINSSMTDLKVNNNSLGTATIFTSGFYFSRNTSLGDFGLDLSYGVISVADLAATLLLPALDYSRVITDRISISTELAMPIPNDWFHDLNVKENYKSFSLSLGGSVVF